MGQRRWKMRYGKSGVEKRSSHTQRRTVSVSGVVETFLRERGWSDKLQERRVFDVWESVVGRALAKQSTPVSLLNGILKVEVSHPVYANELSLLKTVIIAKLKGKLEDMPLKRRGTSTENRVVDIQSHVNPSFRKVKPSNDDVAKVSESDQRQKAHGIHRNFKSVSPEMGEQVEAAVSVVNDFELRDALKTLFLTQCSDTETEE